jgi:DNA-binding PadR family transcriptional regulator
MPPLLPKYSKGRRAEATDLLTTEILKLIYISMNKKESLRGRLPASGIITRLTLLAFLADHPMHGYEVRKVLEDRHLDRWADIQYGSIYTGLQQLQREGLLQSTEIKRASKRPPQVVYQITDAGRRELQALLQQAWLQPAFAAQPLDVALTFISSLSPETVAHLLEERLGLLEDLVTNLEAQQQQLQAVAPPIQAIITDIFTHTLDRFQAERAWAAYLLERVRNGSYTVQNDLNHSPCEEK